jgi:3-hydroxyacyl-[acyl-carrier-protein] dehydratase
MKMEYFQLIDRIETVGLDPLRLTAKADVPAESTIFEGHFPGYPIMPGVLLIETMAQAAGFCLLWNNCFKKMPFLVAVKSVKLRNFVPPSSSLDVLCEVEHEGSAMHSLV